jgi:2,5-furandicarboxylate decarboxylase 1
VTSGAHHSPGFFADRDLPSFLELLEHTPGQGLAIVEREVDANLELAAVVKALEGRDHRAVMFRNVKDSTMPVVINLYGDQPRTAMALGLPANAGKAETIREFDRRLDFDVAPTVVESAAVHETVHRGDEVDLGGLPVGVHAAQQGGRYINAGVFVVRDEDSKCLNGGIYRVMVAGGDRLTVSVDPFHDLGRIIAHGNTCQQPVPFAIVIGADPALSLASQAKVPMTRDLYAVMGSLVGGPVEVTKCVTNDLLVPARAEIVIEGHIMPGETGAEGPFGEFSYYYGSDPAATLCRVDAITHRTKAVYADIHPVHADHRSLWLHPGREASLLRRIRALVPDVTMVSIPLEGAGMVAIISIDKRHNGDSRRALLFGMASDVFIKHAVIVDDDIDVHDPARVLWALATRFQADRDIVVVPNMRGYAEDPSGYFIDADHAHGRVTTKIGYDATLVLGGDFPDPADVPPSQYPDIDGADYVINPLNGVQAHRR